MLRKLIKALCLLLVAKEVLAQPQEFRIENAAGLVALNCSSNLLWDYHRCDVWSSDNNIGYLQFFRERDATQCFNNGFADRIHQDITNPNSFFIGKRGKLSVSKVRECEAAITEGIFFRNQI